MLEVLSFADVGQGYDLACGEEGRLAVTLGRHCGDFVTSFYTWNPSGFMIEYGWGARDIDPATWQPSERRERPSNLGHYPIGPSPPPPPAAPGTPPPPPHTPPPPPAYTHPP